MKLTDPSFLLSFTGALVLFARVRSAVPDHDHDYGSNNSKPSSLRRRLPDDGNSSGVSGLVLMYTGVNPSVPVMTLSFDVVNVVDLRTLSLPNAQFSIDALTTLDSKSVAFSNGQCETAAPLAYCGNSGPEFRSCPNLVLGANVTVTATTFAEKYCVGTAISSRSVRIHIVQTTTPGAAPTLVAAPIPAISMAPRSTMAPVSAVTMTPVNATMKPTMAPITPVMAPTGNASPPLSAITDLVLMYTGVDPSIPIMRLSSESINLVDLQALSLPFAKFSIDAKITPDAKSVTFSNGQCETAAPLAYCGNYGFTFKACPDLVLGANVTVTAIAYSERYGVGVALSQRSATIHIVQSSSRPAPSMAPVVSSIPQLGTHHPPTLHPLLLPTVVPILTTVKVVTSAPIPTKVVTSAPVPTIVVTSAPVPTKVVVPVPVPTKVATSAPVPTKIVVPVPVPAKVVVPVPVPTKVAVPVPVPTKIVTSAPVPTKVVVPVPVPTKVVVPVKGCSIPRFTGEWDSNTAKYPIQVAEAQGTMIGNDFIITSGFNGGYSTATPETYALDMFTPNSRWRRMDDMPFPLGLTHVGVAVKGMKAYFCGGYVAGSLGVHNGSCFQYDHSIAPGMGQWTNFSSLPDGGRAGGGMIYDSSIDALIYSAGSHRPKQHVAFAIDYQNTWMYSLRNPDAGWVPRADIPFKGNHMNFVTAHDETGKERHYFFGGQHGDNEETGNTDEMFEYNAVTDVWTKRQSIPYPLGHAAATARPIGCGFIVAGGRLNHGLSKAITYYDIPTNTWTKIGDLTQEIHTNVCVIANGFLRCETGWATGTFSWKRSITV